MDLVDRLAAEHAQRQAQQIEDALLDRDVVAIRIDDNQHAIYSVPAWRKHPIRRARIARYRWHRRRFLRSP